MDFQSRGWLHSVKNIYVIKKFEPVRSWQTNDRQWIFYLDQERKGENPESCKIEWRCTYRIVRGFAHWSEPTSNYNRWVVLRGAWWSIENQELEVLSLSSLHWTSCKTPTYLVRDSNVKLTARIVESLQFRSTWSPRWSPVVRENFLRCHSERWLFNRTRDRNWNEQTVRRRTSQSHTEAHPSKNKSTTEDWM